MRRGKEIPQGSHASMSYMVQKTVEAAKVCLQADSEDELVTIFEDAKKAGLEVQIIRDSGKTEFNGVPTLTALAIGPDEEEKIDRVTGKLRLY